MADSGPGIGRVSRRFSRIFSAVSVHLIEILSLRVIRLKIVIGDRPRRRDAAAVAQLSEILFAQTEKSSTIELGITTHAIISVRMQVLAVLVKPGFLGVVMGVDVHDLGVPVCFFAGHIVAALENQDPLSGGRKVVGERSATGASSDDDHVEAIVGHDANPPFAPQKMAICMASPASASWSRNCACIW